MLRLGIVALLFRLEVALQMLLLWLCRSGQPGEIVILNIRGLQVAALVGGLQVQRGTEFLRGLGRRGVVVMMMVYGVFIMRVVPLQGSVVHAGLHGLAHVGRNGVHINMQQASVDDFAVDLHHGNVVLRWSH